MVEFVQHPHILKYQIDPGQPDSVQDEDGNWETVPADPELIEFECRAVPNGKGEMITGANGDKIQFDFLIYALPDVAKIPDETNVEIYNAGVLIGSGTTKRMFIAQLNSRIWV